MAMIHFALVFIFASSLEGDKSCKQDKDCSPVHSCMGCNHCFSRAPDISQGDCKMFCEPKQISCACQEGRCTEIISATRLKVLKNDYRLKYQSGPLPEEFKSSGMGITLFLKLDRQKSTMSLNAEYLSQVTCAPGENCITDPKMNHKNLGEYSIEGVDSLPCGDMNLSLVDRRSNARLYFQTLNKKCGGKHPKNQLARWTWDIKNLRNEAIFVGP